MGPVRLRRYRRRPRVSIVGMGSGVVGGLAAVVLLQQTGRLFPSYEILSCCRRRVGGRDPHPVTRPSCRDAPANRRVAAREAAINTALRRQAAAQAGYRRAPPRPLRAAAAPAAWVATHRVTTTAPVRSEPSWSSRSDLRAQLRDGGAHRRGAGRLGACPVGRWSAMVGSNRATFERMTCDPPAVGRLAIRSPLHRDLPAGGGAPRAAPLRFDAELLGVRRRPRTEAIVCPGHGREPSPRS